MKTNQLYSECYLLRIEPTLLNESRSIASVKGISVAAFIRQAISRTIVYHNKVEKPLYDEFFKGASEVEPPTVFFDNEFGISEINCGDIF